jgi:NAD(P)-dependent dehydrogenase (short-subunit alcohol dehydrogenase family)
VNVDGKVAVVTGAGGGIGAALAAALSGAGARVMTTDLKGDVDVIADVSRTDEVARVLDAAGGAAAVDLYCANAGLGGEQGIGEDEEQWARILDVNVLAHVRAARLLLPGWLERGSGYFVATASAAGLLTQIGAAPYSVTKHAAVAFAEWLSITYGDRGVRVSCLCPMGVKTPLLMGGLDMEGDEGVGARVVQAAGNILEPDQVAGDVVDAMREERFLILPHPEVLKFMQNKTGDYERWLAGMRKLQAYVTGAAG